MSKISMAETLILSIVAEQPIHAYDINKVMVRRNIRKWADIGFSSIYYVLDKLETKKLLQSDAAEGKEKKIYGITEVGRNVLIEQTNLLLSVRHSSQAQFMMGLASSWILNDQHLKNALSKRLSALEGDLKQLEIAQERSVNTSEPARKLFSLSESLLEAEISWVKQELDRI